jgi:hypothetical protein
MKMVVIQGIQTDGFNMNYAVKILEDEHRILSMAIKDVKAFDNHPEAYKDRMKKLSEIRKAINLITK